MSWPLQRSRGCKSGNTERHRLMKAKGRSRRPAQIFLPMRTATWTERSNLDGSLLHSVPVEVGAVVAVACAAEEDEYMGGQPFWLAKVVRLTRISVVLRRQVPAALHPSLQQGQVQASIYVPS